VNYLSVDNIFKSFGDRNILDGVSFGLDRGDKVALVGINGDGKSTLLRIIAGEETVDSGEVRLNKDIKVGNLDQNPEFKEDGTVLNTVLQGDSPVLKTVKKYHEALDNGSESIDKLAEDMDSLGGWDLESKISQILGKLGITDPSENVINLSGGMKKRVALAKTLLEEPDFLILDEPTNHLDLNAIEWLENYLSSQNTTLLLVTHDRYFLDKICDSILEVDTGKVYKHKGNYVSFLENKSARQGLEKIDVDKAKNLLQKEMEWLRRQPKARGTKAKYRVDRVDDIQKVASSGRKVSDLDLSLGTNRQGKKILELKHISKAFSENVILNNFSYVFKRGEKLGIVGKNGTGKSTFLNILTGSCPIDEGEIDKGKNTSMGYYKQEEFPFIDSMKVIDAVQEVADIIKTPEGAITASQLLNRFMFPPKKQHDFVGKLSGGEKKRLQLLRVLIKNPNFLIFDEPTNDLDIVTLNILEDYLQKFTGCLLLVSHDRYFMDKLVDHLFIFEGKGNIIDFTGNYTDYRSSKQERTQMPKTSEKSGQPEKPRHNQSRKLSYKEKLEFEKLEPEIQQLENEKSEIEKLLNSGESDHLKLAKWGKELENINSDLEQKEYRWLELSELAE